MQTKNNKIKSYIGLTIITIFAIGLIAGFGGKNSKLLPPQASARGDVTGYTFSQPAIFATLVPPLSVSVVSGAGCYVYKVTALSTTGTPVATPAPYTSACISSTSFAGPYVPSLSQNTLYQLTSQACVSSGSGCSAFSVPLYFFKIVIPPPALFAQNEYGAILKYNPVSNTWPVFKNPTFTLKVKTVNEGLASGTVTSTPAGINCSLARKSGGNSGYGTGCSYDFPRDTIVTLTKASANSQTRPTTGDCDIYGVVKMDLGDKECTFTFTPPAGASGFDQILGRFYDFVGSIKYLWDTIKGWFKV